MTLIPKKLFKRIIPTEKSGIVVEENNLMFKEKFNSSFVQF